MQGRRELHREAPHGVDDHERASRDLPRRAHGRRALGVPRRELLRLDKSGFRPLAGLPFHAATGAWALSDSDLWVAEAATSTLHHFDGAKWTQLPSPVRGPRGLWASSPSDFWLVGEEGAAHFDGSLWSRVEGASQPLELVSGRGPKDVWLAGASGLWHGTE